jgi:cytochrome P450
MEDIQIVLNDSNFVAAEPSKLLADLAQRSGRNYDPIISVLGAHLFFKEGDRHRRGRRTIAQIMNRKALSQIEPVIEALAAGLTSKLLRLTEYDAIAQFADPFPQLVMAHILDLPLTDVPILSNLLAQLTMIFDTVPLDVYDNINCRVTTALDLLKSRIAKANRDSAETALSIIYQATLGSERDRMNDAAALTLFTYRAGAETTIGMIGLLIRTLIQKPELCAMVRKHPPLASAIGSEVLRLEANVQRSVRIARTTQVIGGKTIEAGQRITLLLGAANRDPAAFTEPDSLSLDGQIAADVTFGGGHHFCLGASLARLEGRIALLQFVHLPALERSGKETWYLGRTIRRLTQLPVRVIGPSPGGL